MLTLKGISSEIGCHIECRYSHSLVVVVVVVVLLVVLIFNIIR